MLDLHLQSFDGVVGLANLHQHPVPTDTRGWSQILVSILTGVPGRGRQKGTDLVDGSDVKGCCTWDAIDHPRFNGVIKAGTKAATSGSIQSLDAMPFIYFVLWDLEPSNKDPRCRVWAVRSQKDLSFRKLCATWYAKWQANEVSSNFQLHPPSGSDSNVFRNTCGNLKYPLLFSAVAPNRGTYKQLSHDPLVLISGTCS